MRLIPWDPDIQTVVSRIESGALDLQPNFQRGEVWSRGKKQRLIDSILRDWHVPPIHVIENTATKSQEVLDGQQRLVAIRDFQRGDFPVDGTVEPLDEGISALHGTKYRDLPTALQRQFDQFTLRIYKIVDYRTSEPAELFFRLNQPTNLTSAEQRNAFFGPVRGQIKKLVKALADNELDTALLGFNNARMSYDDVISRVALTLRRGSLSVKIRSADLVELYRDDAPLSTSDTSRIDLALKLLGEASHQTNTKPKFNKATAYSWLLFVIRANDIAPDFSSSELALFLSEFEAQRKQVETYSTHSHSQRSEYPIDWWIYHVYNDRSTSRVADVSSVLLRDLAIWFSYLNFTNSQKTASARTPLSLLLELKSKAETCDEDTLAKLALDSDWGSLK